MKFQSVFDAHPDVQTLFVVSGQPFIDRKHADNYAKSVKGAVKVVNRPKPDPEGEAPEEPKAKSRANK